ncbi:hypothetical protein BGZ89_005781, partial [Linnemannia elongata]
MIEASLQAKGADKAIQMPGFCAEPLMQYMCSVAYPRVEATGVQNTYDVRFACASTCQQTYDQCAKLLAVFDMEAAIPNCNAPIPESTQYAAPTGIMFQPDGKCNALTSLGGPSTALSNITAECDAPFVKDPLYPAGTANPNYCMYGCCLPCPAQYHLYREDALHTGFTITNYMRAVSMVLSFLLVLTYLVLDDKRSHPSALILFFAVGVFLFSAVIIFPLIDTKAIQCADLITPSTQRNNLKCAIQGAILVFASVATCA